MSCSQVIDRGGEVGVSFTLHPGQWRAWMSEARFVLVLAGTQGGKALDVETPIPTPCGNGFTTMRDLRVGDFVFDENKMPTRVLAVTDEMVGHKCFEVCFDDGSSLVADEDHQWVTRFGDTNESGVVTTRQIKATLKDGVHWITNVGFRKEQTRAITGVYRVKSRPVKCISVDSKSRQYLAGRQYIATHNTTFGPLWLDREIQLRGEGDYYAITTNFHLFSVKMLPVLREHFCGLRGWRYTATPPMLHKGKTRILLNRKAICRGFFLMAANG